MNRLPLLALGAATITALLACQPKEEEPAVEGPRIADLSTQNETTLIDRQAALEGAVDFDQAAEGQAIDFTDAGYMMEIDGSAITDNDANRTYNNWTAAVVATAAADLVAAAVIAPPAAGIHLVAQGQITQLAPNVWQANNTVDIGGQQVSGVLTVAWVGVGWVSEMRYSNDTVTDKLWFNGFLSYENAVGWWDLYDENDQHAGVVEWISDGTNGEFGIAALAGENAGDSLVYTVVDDHHRIDYHDDSAGEDAWVDLQPDLSGSVRLPGFAGGAISCWDTTFNDVACPMAM
ncbi:MAG: hypothetical protein KC656_32840 [Myxococcales bacterium]|nr:hypothetical protein [Myxococcales bacterium]MCB9692390.1 hypothetical protein [Alphaproteobacteria bacterium]